VSPDGTVLDPAGFAIGVAAQYQWTPDVAFDGTNYLVSWMDRRTGVWDIYGARVTPAGSVLDQSGIPISTAPDYQVYPALAFGDADYLVVWTDKRDGVQYHAHGARVTPSGSVRDPGGIPISTAAQQDFPAVAFGGTNYLAVWTDARSQTGSDIYGSRVSTAGAVWIRRNPDLRRSPCPTTTTTTTAAAASATAAATTATPTAASATATPPPPPPPRPPPPPVRSAVCREC
jgi:hypothetical protein